MDVGNTNITAGIFVEKDLVELFRITTKLPRTSDEFGILIRDMIAAKGLDTKEISAAIIGCAEYHVFSHQRNHQIF